LAKKILISLNSLLQEKMTNNSDQLLYQIALTKVDGVGDILAKRLVETLGDAENIFKADKKTLMSIDGISRVLSSEIQRPDVLNRAEKELLFVQKNNIDTYFYKDEAYPYRLKECIDAPILLYYKGNADWNEKKVISIVGTRKSTNYGIEFCHDFLQEIASSFLEVLVISGLAYGIDIHAHRAALKFNLPTIGVLAHGLDRIYPSSHRKIAIEMLENGGLLTEFSSETEPDKYNFVRRNRIVAGMADATIVVQSDIKGGSLITAELANSYDRDVFAVPGRINDKESAGCNTLIEKNKAAILPSTDSFIHAMGWDITITSKPKQQQLFHEFTSDEQIIYDLLTSTGALHINMIANQTAISMSSLLPILLNMEMKNIIKVTSGNIYELR